MEEAGPSGQGQAADQEWTKPGPEKRSDIWQHLLVSKKEKKSAKCRHCDKVFKHQGSTTSMTYHLYHKHGVRCGGPPIPPLSHPENKRKIDFWLKVRTSSSPELSVAKLAAVDGISFSTLASSTEIRKGWEAQGLKVPETKAGIQAMMMRYSSKLKEDLKEHLAEKKKTGEQFSLSFDEWTSKRNQRYLCLNIHSQEQVHGLGMLRVKGSLPAERAKEMISAHLETFGLSLHQDILGATTDGASVMKKLGRLLGTSHQLCHSHGIHLAVADVLYKEGGNEKEIEGGEEDKEGEEEEEEEEEEDGDDLDFQNSWQEEEEDHQVELTEAYGPVVKKVRKIASFFRTSPTRNDLLQVCGIVSYCFKLLLFIYVYFYV